MLRILVCSVMVVRATQGLGRAQCRSLSTEAYFSRELNYVESTPPTALSSHPAFYCLDAPLLNE